MNQSPRNGSTPLKLGAAAFVGLASTFACAAATSSPEARSADVVPLTTQGAEALAADGGSPDAADGGCPNGALEDPHRGFVRCLGPGERSPFEPAPGDAGSGDAGASPGDGGASPGDAGAVPAPTGTPGPTASATPPAPSATPAPTPAPTPTPEPPKAPGPPPLVEMKAPKFENGNVPKAEKNLSAKKVLEAIGQCVADGGGLSGKTGSLKVEMLVRVRGKAEGVEVTPTNVSAGAAKCVQTLLKNKALGTPDADPVGITVVYTLKPAGK